MKRGPLVSTMALAPPALLLAGCSVFQIPKRVDTLVGTITEAATANTAMTNLNRQAECAAVAKRFYAGVGAGDGHAFTGFCSNHNGGTGTCFMACGVTRSSAARVFRKTAMVDPVRRFLYGSCTVAKDRSASGVTHCRARRQGSEVRNLSARQFREYQARFMVPARGTARE